MKNCVIGSYLENTDSAITRFIEAMHGFFDYDSKVVIDVKFHTLSAGKHTCIPGWHIDGTLLTSENETLDTYLLYVSGDDAFTEFCLDPVEVERSTTSVTMLKSYNANETISLKSGQFAKYDWKNMHRGVPAKVHSKRLLIRLAKSAVIKGNSFNQAIFQPTIR